MSDTPRMNAARNAAMEHMTGDVYRVGCDIEQQLNAANVEIDEKRKDIVYLATEKAKLEERINRLEEMYEKEIGENDKFIGTNLQALLTRELNTANERIKRLVQAGDCLLSHRNSTDYHEKVREWDKAKKDKP